MIISKTPLRISFFSGGSDLPSFYEQTNGAALSATIDKFIYVSVHSKPKAKHYITSFDSVEDYDNLDHMTHDITRESLKYFNIKNKVHVASISDVPSKGSGLGSSSAFTVGLVNCISQTNDSKLMAEAACIIEMDRCKYPIGKQDQYAAAIGGLNLYSFTKQEVTHSPINISTQSLERLQRNLLLVYSGIGRSANIILKEQSLLMNNEEKFNLVLNGRNKAIAAADLLERGVIDSFGELLHLAWLDKKNIVKGITNNHIDEIYDLAIKYGCYGGKILGAGGGGFLLFYCIPEKQETVKQILSKKTDCIFYDFAFQKEGSKIIYSDETL